ncbi:hypothetical protein D3C75_811190 [compost metagenome]
MVSIWSLPAYVQVAWNGYAQRGMAFWRTGLCLVRYAGSLHPLAVPVDALYIFGSKPGDTFWLHDDARTAI